MIRLENVSFDSSRGAFCNINFNLGSGETAVILGPRRSGKTEFLHVCLGLHPYRDGEAFFGGKKLNPFATKKYGHFARNIGIVTQHITLLDNLTVVANVGLSLSYHKGMEDSAMRKRVAPLLERFGIRHIAEKFPHEISDMEAKMAMMARAVVENPKLIVLDEPTAGDLDPAGFMMVMNAITSFRNDGVAMIIATTSPSLASIKNARLHYLVDRLLVPHSEAMEIADPLASEFFAQIKDYTERQRVEISPFYKNVISNDKSGRQA
jgi:ABC-type ATPase involved in cell division